MGKAPSELGLFEPEQRVGAHDRLASKGFGALANASLSGDTNALAHTEVEGTGLALLRRASVEIHRVRLAAGLGSLEEEAPGWPARRNRRRCRFRGGGALAGGPLGGAIVAARDNEQRSEAQWAHATCRETQGLRPS